MARIGNSATVGNKLYLPRAGYRLQSNAIVLPTFIGNRLVHFLQDAIDVYRFAAIASYVFSEPLHNKILPCDAKCARTLA
jgi:hypothetical protein